MKFLLLFLFFIIKNIHCEATFDIQGPKEARVEWFPYMVVIEPVYCAGILISEHYVITPAYCVDGNEEVTVYLGFHGTPETEANLNEIGTQTRKSSHVIVHENFNSNDDEHLNNIAVVRLSQPAILNEKVFPIQLASKSDMFQMSNKFANITGWFSQKNNDKMHYETVRLFDLDTCVSYLGSELIKSHEECALSDSPSNFLNVMGDAVVINKKAAGYLIKRRSCLETNERCKKLQLFLSLAPFLNWISEKTNIPLEKITGDNEMSLEKLGSLDHLIRKMQVKQEEEDDKMNIKIEALRNEQKNLTAVLNEIIIEERRIGKAQMEDLEKNINDLRNIKDICNKVSEDKINEENQKKLVSELEVKMETISSMIKQTNERVKKILEYLTDEPLAT